MLQGSWKLNVDPLPLAHAPGDQSGIQIFYRTPALLKFLTHQGKLVGSGVCCPGRAEVANITPTKLLNPDLCLNLTLAGGVNHVLEVG